MKFYVCNIKEPVGHCKNNCDHGEPHELNKCSIKEWCGITDKEVKCRPLTKKEKKFLKGRGI